MGGKTYQKEKKKKMGKFLERLKRDFAWENDEYETPEEAPFHPEISADFPGILMDGDDEEPIWDSMIKRRLMRK